MEMVPRTDYGGMPLRGTKLADAVKELRDNALGKEERGIRYRERPIIEDSLEEIRDRRVRRVERNLERERNRQPDPMLIALEVIGANAKMRLSQMLDDHFKRVPVSDGELDDMAGD